MKININRMRKPLFIIISNYIIGTLIIIFNLLKQNILFPGNHIRLFNKRLDFIILFRNLIEKNHKHMENDLKFFLIYLRITRHFNLLLIPIILRIVSHFEQSLEHPLVDLIFLVVSEHE